MERRTVPGRTVVLWMGAGALVMLAAFWMIFQRGVRISAAQQHRSATLAGLITTPTGPMRLVPAGKFMAGEDPVPVNLPAFYISVDPLKAGLPFREAKQFCESHGQRLPTTIQWEKAFEISPSLEEWVEEPHKPKQFELRAFQDRLSPPASLEEEWSTVRGGAGARRTDYRSAPVRYAAPTLAFRCAVNPP